MTINYQLSIVNSYSVSFGSKTIKYKLEYSGRKTLGITVTPEMEVLVKAPYAATREKIDAILHKKAGWILKQQSFFLTYFPKQPRRSYVSGESHSYLGRQYRLKVIRGSRHSVKLSGQYIYVYINKNHTVKESLDRWYKEHAEVKFPIYLAEWLKKFKRYDVKMENFEIRKMQKRWGSCTAKNKIILNTELVKAPKGCIEYVIMHELCHLVYHGHNSKFLMLQTKMMPDWEKWKDRLEKFLA
jgi:predicted metal-dependent hydrolase